MITCFWFTCIPGKPIGILSANTQLLFV